MKKVSRFVISHLESDKWNFEIVKESWNRSVGKEDEVYVVDDLGEDLTEKFMKEFP